MHKYVKDYLERIGIEVVYSPKDIDSADTSKVVLELKEKTDFLLSGMRHYILPRGHYYIAQNIGERKIIPIKINIFSLDKAVRNEHFEEAAIIRDIMRKNQRRKKSIEQLVSEIEK